MRKFIVVIVLVLLFVGAGGLLLLRQPHPAISSDNSYAALGDSVAAGVGLPASALATHQDTLCRRSASAYPVLVATARHYDLNDVACSGAKINDLIGSQKIKSDFVPSQIDRAFKNGAPKLITISIGANDIQFTSVLADCYASDCTTAAHTADVQKRIATVGSNLQSTVEQIKSRSQAKTKVVVVGYYHLLADGCSTFAPQVTAAEVTWINDRTTELNVTLQMYATAAGAAFAPVDFSGHDLCSSDSWVQGLSSTGALHPTAAGQAAIASSIENVLN